MQEEGAVVLAVARESETVQVVGLEIRGQKDSRRKGSDKNKCSMKCGLYIERRGSS